MATQQSNYFNGSSPESSSSSFSERVIRSADIIDAIQLSRERVRLGSPSLPRSRTVTPRCSMVDMSSSKGNELVFEDSLTMGLEWQTSQHRSRDGKQAPTGHNDGMLTDHGEFRPHEPALTATGATRVVDFGQTPSSSSQSSFYTGIDQRAHEIFRVDDRCYKVNTDQGITADKQAHSPSLSKFRENPIQPHESELAALREYVQELESSNETLKTRNVILKKHVSDVYEDINELQEENEELRNEVEELRAGNTRIATQLRSSNVEFKRLKNRVEGYERLNFSRATSNGCNTLQRSVDNAAHHRQSAHSLPQVHDQSDFDPITALIVGRGRILQQKGKSGRHARWGHDRKMPDALSSQIPLIDARQTLIAGDNDTLEFGSDTSDDIIRFPVGRIPEDDTDQIVDIDDIDDNTSRQEHQSIQSRPPLAARWPRARHPNRISDATGSNSQIYDRVFTRKIVTRNRNANTLANELQFEEVLANEGFQPTNVSQLSLSNLAIDNATPIYIALNSLGSDLPLSRPLTELRDDIVEDFNASLRQFVITKMRVLGQGICVRRRIARKATELFEEQKACKYCEKHGHFCFRHIDQNFLALMPLRQEKRRGTPEDLEYWIDCQSQRYLQG